MDIKDQEIQDLVNTIINLKSANKELKSIADCKHIEILRILDEQIKEYKEMSKLEKENAELKEEIKELKMELYQAQGGEI